MVSYRKDSLKKLDNLQTNHLPPPPCSDESRYRSCRCRVEKEASHDDESIFNANEG